MIFKQIKYFVSIVRNNSFTEAAEECYISQSAISQAIKSLEDEIGTTLLKRNNRTFTLMPAGEYFYKQGIILIDEVERLKQETLKIANNNTNKLKVGYLNCYSGLGMHKAVFKFCSDHQDIDIEIVTGNHEKLYDLLRSNNVDIILSDQRRALSNEYINHHLFTSTFYIEVSEESPLKNLQEIEIKDLKRIPCILVASTDQEKIEEEYYRNTLGFENEFIFVPNIEEGRILVAANKGFMPLEGIPNADQSNKMTVNIPLVRDGEKITKKYYAFWKKQTSNKYKEGFAKILKEVLDKLQ